MVVEARKREEAARHARGILEAARALASYELEPSGAAAAHAKAYGEAVSAFTNALNATIIYLQDIKNDPAVKTRGKDIHISGLWKCAHAALFAFDSDLANRCFIKSQGWLDPSVWASPEYAEIGVTIPEMRKALLAFQKRRGGAYSALEDAPNTKKEGSADTIIQRWKSTRIGTWVIIIIVLVAGAAGFLDNVSKIKTFFTPSPRVTSSSEKGDTK